ncbi:MAG: adenylate/guanylate cyclase domain-containing protein, partial [Kiloniellales bacterium]|nr:adenylate/guanylate cyclase domain-containing protein [Kiloniellales bacterium]
EERADIPAGRYRLRTLEAGGEITFNYEGSGFPAFILKDDEFLLGEKTEPGTFRIVNGSAHPRVGVLEECRWARDALTADRVTTLQAFRDLFSDQVLRPGDEVALRHVTFLFTDLKGSTALYNSLGDAEAYHTVRRHFAFLTEIVRRHEGAIVKTIGDAVMASFIEPKSALKAALEVQEKIGEFNSGEAGGSIILKLGLHSGPAIAVTLNERLDYFGATVNMAARLQGQSKGGDIVCSMTIAGDPAAAALVPFDRLSPEEARLKGFDEPVPFYRVTSVNGAQ